MRFVVTILGVFLLATSASAGQAVLTWTDNSDNEANFNIERGTAADLASCPGATFSALASVGANVITYTDLALSEGTTYCYRVNASNSAGVSAWSNVAGKTIPFTVPGAPSGLIVQ